jgi:phosphate uptake regulator
LITTRKLNQVRNSFYVYLPRQWCESYGLTKESEVRIQQTAEGTLLIMPPGIEPKAGSVFEYQVDDENKTSIDSLLIGAYIVGVGGLELNFAESLDIGTRENISRWIRRLPGFEILEEHRRSITVSDTSEKQVIIPVLRRQFATTKYMLNGILRAMEPGQLEVATRIVDRDEDVDRHRYFVERLCHLALQDPAYARKIEITPQDCLHFSLAAKYVERIADHICAVSNEIFQIKSITNTTKKVAKELVELYNITTKTFFGVDGSEKTHDNFGKDTKEAFAALDMAKSISQKIEKMESSKKGLDPHMVLLLLHFERIASYCADIAEVAVNRIIEARI